MGAINFIAFYEIIDEHLARHAFVG